VDFVSQIVQSSQSGL